MQQSRATSSLRNIPPENVATLSMHFALRPTFSNHFQYFFVKLCQTNHILLLKAKDYDNQSIHYQGLGLEKQPLKVVLSLWICVGFRLLHIYHSKKYFLIVIVSTTKKHK